MIDATSSVDINDAARGALRQAGVVRWYLDDSIQGDCVDPTVMIWGSEMLGGVQRWLLRGGQAGRHLVTIGASDAGCAVGFGGP